MRSTLCVASAIGLASVLAGITIAYYANLPPGGTTVLVAAGAVVLAELVALAHPLSRRTR